MKRRKIFKNLKIHSIINKVRVNSTVFKRPLHQCTLIKRQIKTQSKATIISTELIILKSMINKQQLKDNNKHTFKEYNQK